MSNGLISYLISSRKKRFGRYVELLELLASENKIETSILDYFDDVISKESCVKNEEINRVLKKLESRYYCLTDEDIKVLGDNYVFVSGSRKYHNNGEDSFIVLSDNIMNADEPDKLLEAFADSYGSVYLMSSVLEFSVEHYKHLMKIKKWTEQYPDKVKYIPCAGDLAFVGGFYDLRESRAVSAYDAKRMFFSAADEEFMPEENVGRFLSYEEKEKYLREKDAVLGYDEELIKWLSGLPIQRVHVKEGISYCIASRLFDQQMMDVYPNCSLKDYVDDFGLRPEINDILGYDLQLPWYDSKKCPEDWSVVISVNYPSFSKALITEEGKKIPLVTIEEWKCYDGNLVDKYLHALQIDADDETYEMVVNSVLDGVFDDGAKAFDPSNHRVDIPNSTFMEVVDGINGEFGFSYSCDDHSFYEKYAMFKKIVVLDVIINSTMVNKQFIEALDDYLTEGSNISDIPTSVDVMYLIDALGKDNMKEVLSSHNCESISAYAELKFGGGEKSGVKVFSKLDDGGHIYGKNE